MKRSYLLCLGLLSLCGLLVATPEGLTPVDSTELLNLPAWMQQVPQNGDFTLGIAWKDPFGNQHRQEALQYAAVQLARNRQCFAVSKAGRQQTESESGAQDGRSVDFEVNVSAQPPSYALCDSLQVVDSVFVDSYYIVLCRLGGTTAENSPRTGTAPLSFEPIDQQTVVDGDFVYTTVVASDADFPGAYAAAAQKARLELAKYRMQSVRGGVLENTGTVTKCWTQETSLVLRGLSPTRVAVQRQLRENQYRYYVALEMRMPRP